MFPVEQFLNNIAEFQGNAKTKYGKGTAISFK